MHGTTSKRRLRRQSNNLQNDNLVHITQPPPRKSTVSRCGRQFPQIVCIYNIAPASRSHHFTSLQCHAAADNFHRSYVSIKQHQHHAATFRSIQVLSHSSLGTHFVQFTTFREEHYFQGGANENESKAIELPQAIFRKKSHNTQFFGSKVTRGFRLFF